jgi:drug/metabolite transporter (DMT)-like permease
MAAADGTETAERTVPRAVIAFSALAFGAIFMGASPIFVRWADVGPQASAFWRVFLALPFLWLWAWWETRQEGTAAVSPPPFAPELGSTRVRHNESAEVGYIRLRLEGQGGGTRGTAFRSNPLPTPPPQAGEGARSARGTAGAHSSFDTTILLTGILFAGDLFFWHLAILGTTVANATLLATTIPIWVALGALLFLSERITRATLAGILLCLAGGATLVGDSFGFAPQRLWGDIYGLITAVFFGGYVLAVRAARARHSAGRLAFVGTTVTAVCLLVAALTMEPTLIPRSIAGGAALVALALVSQVAGQGLLAVALGTLPATFSSLVLFIEGIAAALFGWLIFGETLGPAQAIGGVLILIGIWVARPKSNPTAGP